MKIYLRFPRLLLYEPACQTGETYGQAMRQGLMDGAHLRLQILASSLPASHIITTGPGRHWITDPLVLIPSFLSLSSNSSLLVNCHARHWAAMYCRAQENTCTVV